MPDAPAKLCLFCGYPLDGIPSACPECGLEDAAARRKLVRGADLAEYSVLALSWLLIVGEFLVPLYVMPSTSPQQRAETFGASLVIGVASATAYVLSMLLLWAGRVLSPRPTFWVLLLPALLTLPWVLLLYRMLHDACLIPILLSPWPAAMITRALAPGRPKTSI